MIKKYIKQKNEMIDNLINNRDKTLEKNKTPVLITLSFIFLMLIFVTISNVLLKNITDGIVKNVFIVYFYVFQISLLINIAILLSFSFDKLSDNCIVNMKRIFNISIIVLEICILPVLIFNSIIEFVFGEKNDITFVLKYFCLEIHFIIALLAFLLFVLQKFNLTSLNFDSIILVITISSYVLTLIWFVVYNKFLNIESKDKTEIRQAHNRFLYIVLFVIFFINNYVISSKSINITNAINNSITSVTLLVLIIDERANKKNNTEQ